MACIRFTDGSRKFVPEPIGVRLWRCLHGLAAATEDQRDYLARVRTVYLNWRTAPDEYIRRNLPDIVEAVTKGWVVDSDGRPLRPSTQEEYAFAAKWGLWVNGHPSALVTDPRLQTQLV